MTWKTPRTSSGPWKTVWTWLLEESLDEGECGVGDVGPAVVEDQGVAAAFDFDVFGGFGVLELLLVAAVGECPGGGGVVGAGDDQQWPPVGVLDIYAGVPAKHEVGETRLKEGFSGRGHVVGVIQLAGLGLVEVVGPAVLELLERQGDCLVTVGRIAQHRRARL